jgi:hypothetical protein
MSAENQKSEMILTPSALSRNGISDKSPGKNGRKLSLR